MRTKPNWSLTKKNIEELKPYEKNPRTITKKGLSDLEDSLEEFGMADVIIINTDNTIIGGHARYFLLKASHEIKKKSNKKHKTILDCYVPDRKLTAKEVKILNVRLNKNIAGEFDTDMLANLFEVDDLLKVGFKQSELGLTAGGDFAEEKGEIKFTEELLEEHNYVVLYFDNSVDWLQAKTLLGLKTVKALDSKAGYEKKGIGRVLKGAEAIERLRK